MSESIAKQWLQDAANSANTKDHAAYMALISKNVSLEGAAGFEHFSFDDWSAQIEYDFSDNILQFIRYEGFKLLTTTDTQITFKTFETVKASDGTVNAQGIEVLLEKEEDGVWRLRQERILPDDEAKHDGLI